MLTNDNLKKTENAVDGTNVPFLPLKLTANWNFYFLTVNETARKSFPVLYMDRNISNIIDYKESVIKDFKYPKIDKI